MIERFQGGEGRRRLVAALTEHRLIANREELVERLVAAGELKEVPAGTAFINQSNQTSDVFFIIAGKVEIRVNEKKCGVSLPGRSRRRNGSD